MTRAGLISRAILLAALGVAVGHLAAVVTYQRDRSVEIADKLSEPALVEHWHYQSVVEQRTVAVACEIIVLCAAAGAARGIGEAVVLIINAFAMSGLTAAAELWALRYHQIPWPLLPLDIASPPASIVAANAAVVSLVVLIYSSAFRGIEEHRGKKSSGSSRRRTVRRPTSAEENERQM